MKITTLLALIAALAFAGCGTTAWKEEVELHDGRKIVVDRYQSYGGLHEIGQGSPVRTQEIRFIMPGRHWPISFKSEYSDDVGRANLILLALHIKEDVPYLVTEPNLILAYNKWGRPNPPYVIFKHDGKDWQRIPIAELPSDFKTMNLIISTMNKEPKFNKFDAVPAEQVRAFNRELSAPKYKEIHREPFPDPSGGRDRLIRIKGGWEGLGFFESRGSLESCREYCELQGVTKQDCPCNELFEQK